MSKIHGNIRKILFSGNNGYTVGLIKVRECSNDLKDFLNKTITFTANVFEINMEINYVLEGEIINHPRYGMQFSASSITVEKPTDEEGIVLYLSSGIFKGIGYKTAKNIVNRFGKKSIEIIKNNYTDLLLVPNMTEKKAKMLHNKMQELDSDQELIIMLNNLGFTTKESLRIINNYKLNILDILNENIYILKDIVDFNKLDLIFLKENDEDNKIRIKALIPYIMNNLMYKNGSTILEVESIYLNFIKYFKKKIKLETFIYYLEELNKEGEVILLENKATLKEYYESEKNISTFLKKLNKIKDYYDEAKIDLLIKNYSKENKIIFNEEQKEAIKRSLLSNLFVITGGPGTGKTTIIKGIVEIYKKLLIDEYKGTTKMLSKSEITSEITLLAPTGRSAKRLGESVNMEASTIHKFLKWNLETKSFGINEFNKSDARLVIIDEASMIDIFLFSSLLKGLKDKVKLIIVGDSFQLPSISPGNVLNDIINSDKINKVYLKEIYRTKKDSYIINFATKIKNKESFTTLKDYTDFKFIESEDVNIKKYLIQISKNYLKKELNIDNFQVLAPMYKGENGIDNLNIVLQEIFNKKDKHKEEIKIGNKIYREKDKVIQLINDLDNNVFNGDIGYIKKIKKEKEDTRIDIDFMGNIVSYKSDKFDNFSHAYAISIHKSQGSEYDNVVIILSKTFKRMFYNKLIYTAVTRAKKSLILIGRVDSLNTSISSSYGEERESLLKQMLNE